MLHLLQRMNEDSEEDGKETIILSLSQGLDLTYVDMQFRRIFKGSLQKKTFFVTNVTLWGGRSERVHVTKKTIASKSFLSNFKHF